MVVSNSDVQEMGAEINMQKTDTKVNDLYCEENKQMVVSTEMSVIKVCS